MNKNISIKINPGYLIIPEKEKQLTATIKESLDLLNLEKDWNDEGAEVISSKTLYNTNAFLVNNYLMIRKLKQKINLPDFGPCSDGSIDLYWKDDKTDFLVNIKESGKLSFYFEKEGVKIKGNSKTNSETNILMLLL